MDKKATALTELIPQRLVPVMARSKPDFHEVGNRVLQAHMKFKEIDELLDRLADEWKGQPFVRAKKVTPDILEYEISEFPKVEHPRTTEIRMRTSEFLLHIRAALDYCAFNIVWIANGRIREGTKFPLVLSTDNWNKERRRSLPGVQPEELAWIEEVQPSKNVRWTRLLAELSNYDKHNRLLEIFEVYKFETSPRDEFADPLGDEDYLGFQVRNVEIAIAIDPPKSKWIRENDEILLQKVLNEILLGAVTLLNQFLGKYGPSTLQVSVGNRSS